MDVFKNLALAQIDVAPTPPTSGTSITLVPGTGAFFPPAPFTIVVFDGVLAATPINAEIIRVTAITGDTLSGLIRRSEGTTARAILAGDYVAQTFTAKFVTDVTNSGSQIAGTLPDARLSANVALKNAANVFTQIQRIQSATPPELQLQFPGDTKGRVLVARSNPYQFCVSNNLAYDGTQWHLDDPSKPGVVLSLGGSGDVTVYMTPPGPTVAFVLLLQLDANGNVSIPGTLTGGTIPDARLSANVALVNAANVFTAWREQIGCAAPRFQLNDLNQAPNARLFEIVNYAQFLYFQSVDDAITVAYGSMWLNRAGVLTVGAGLGSTWLNASQLSQGALADARLSANVALRNVDNRFVVQTFADYSWFSGPNHILYIYCTAAPPNARITRPIDYGDGVFYFECLDDSYNVQNRPLAFARAGHVIVGADLYEKGRATPIGHWIDVPYNPGNFTTSGGAGIWAPQSGEQIQYTYTIIGKTLTVTFYVYGANITGAALPVLSWSGPTTGSMVCATPGSSMVPFSVAEGVWTLTVDRAATFTVSGVAGGGGGGGASRPQRMDATNGGAAGGGGGAVALNTTVTLQPGVSYQLRTGGGGAGGSAGTDVIEGVQGSVGGVTSLYDPSTPSWFLYLGGGGGGLGGRGVDNPDSGVGGGAGGVASYGGSLANGGAGAPRVNYGYGSPNFVGGAGGSAGGGGGSGGYSGNAPQTPGGAGGTGGPQNIAGGAGGIAGDGSTVYAQPGHPSAGLGGLAAGLLHGGGGGGGGGGPLVSGLSGSFGGGGGGGGGCDIQTSFGSAGGNGGNGAAALVFQSAPVAPANATALMIRIPGGFGPGRLAFSPALWHSNASPNGTGMGFIYVQPGDAWMYVYHADQSAWPQGATSIGGTIKISLP